MEILFKCVVECKMTHFPISYMGNKRLDIKYFENYFPDIDSYDTIVEPFAGSGAVSFYLSDNVDHIVLNDKDETIINLYKIWTEQGYEKFKEWAEDENNEKILYQKTGSAGFANKPKTLKISKNTTKKEKWRNALIEKATITNHDFKTVMENLNSRTFVYFDPPYFDSSNKSYHVVNNNEIVDNVMEITDNTKYFIEILEFLQNSPSKILLVVNDNAIMRHIYKDFIKGTYEKIYTRNIHRKGVVYKKKMNHLVICNF